MAQQEHMTGATATGAENLEVMEGVDNYNRHLLNLVRAGLGPARRVLDFGSGRGVFARPLRETGRDVVCVEPVVELRDIVAAAGIEAHASLDSIAPQSLDGVYSLNVLEHIEDDIGMLNELRDRLRPGGRLFLYVPAFQMLYSSMDRRVGHIRRYRRRELIDKCRQAGFEIEASRYCDSLGFLATLVYMAIGSRDGGIDRNALLLYDRVAFPVSRILDNIMGLLAGKNVWVAARRPDN